MPNFTPTDEQKAIVAAASTTRANLMVTAYAGCAKTTTLELIAAALPKDQAALALAFNVKIKKELERRFPSNFTILTLNGLGHRAWQKAIGPRIKLDAEKLSRLLRDALKRHDIRGGDAWSTVRQLVTMARQSGLIPREFPHKGLLIDTPESWDSLASDNWIAATPQHLAIAREVLVLSVTEAFQGIIDFDDQIYMSTMFNGVFPRFGLVMVDEAQDLSPLNHIQVARSAIDRLIVVGDPKQAIYAFRGADSASMGKLRELRANWIDLPLATTFRCPKVVVARQQEHAPGFRAWHTNPAGQVFSWFTQETKTWTWDSLQKQSPTDSLAILCRNNAPLLAMAFALLRQRVGVVMLGRDIGKSLIALSKKILPDDTTPSAEARRMVEDWIQTETSAAIMASKEERVAQITDRGECLLAVLEWTDSAGGLRAALEELFSRETGKVTLATGHRAKGLEWDTVVHLDPWRVPSRQARQALQNGNPIPMEQDLNLRYVIETRAKTKLILANREDFQ